MPAVLPFAALAAEPDTDYLADGITESIINSLSQLPNLAVRSRTSVFRYKGRDADAQAAGQALDVRAVLTGRVVQRGDRLAISAQLTDVRSNRQLWGEQYHRKLADIFAVQEEIAKEISEKLRLRLSGDEKKQLGKRFTESAQAYQLYMKGRFYWNKRTEEGLKKGIDYFEQAIAKDPRYAHLIGKRIVRPLPAELPREQKLIPIIGDEHVDFEFGTGVLKVTPAHDKNDFEIQMNID